MSPYLENSTAASNSVILSHDIDTLFGDSWNPDDDSNYNYDELPNVDPQFMGSSDPALAACQQTPLLLPTGQDYLGQLGSIGNSSPGNGESSLAGSSFGLPNLNTAPKFLSTTTEVEVPPVPTLELPSVNTSQGHAPAMGSQEDVPVTSSQGIDNSLGHAPAMGSQEYFPVTNSQGIDNSLGPLQVASSHNLQPAAGSLAFPLEDNTLANALFPMAQPYYPSVPQPHATDVNLDVPQNGSSWQQPWPVQNQQYANNARIPQSHMPQGNSGPSNQSYPQHQSVTRGKSRADHYANPSGNSGANPVDGDWLREDVQSQTETVSRNRRDKKEQNPKADPSLFYTHEMPYIPTWSMENAIFSYSRTGQWDHDRPFTTQQLRAYFDNCPRDLRIWLQQCPAQCNNRVDPKGRKCRWSECPVRSRAIIAGWYRVAFDEFHELTSNGTKDPFHMAGAMHLWCFEQCFDPYEFFMNRKLQPDTRWLPKEDKTRNNPMLINRDPDTNIVAQAIKPWITKQGKQNAQVMPRAHEESLSYRLLTYHLDTQHPVRQVCRDTRNAKKEVPTKKTADFHHGDLRLCVDQTTAEKIQKQEKKRQAKQNNTDVAIVAPEANLGSIPAQVAGEVSDIIDLSPLEDFLKQANQELNTQSGPAPVEPTAGVSFGPDANHNELIEQLRGKKRPRNDGEVDDDDDDDDDDDSNGVGNLLDCPQRYKRPHKRIRISDREDGEAEFRRMMDRRAGRHGRRYRRRSFCIGDNPRRFQRGSIDYTRTI
ncbi:hypothetical protein G7Z17_g3497 [Cylindrodendrum hubeiense]|uniref:Uncharacterized protein n=1 Tax=Cylindrodendrum hubeiense TaxID=595255 RepID=A0A9P5HAP3_9HYPO|nr:hypothetical protein G7Z17_g3497 [Cylindrodendrum hubeiense]